MGKLSFTAQFLLFLLFCSCGQNKTPEKQANIIQQQEQIVVPDSLFKIISEKDHVDPRFGYNKCNIHIELKTKLSKEELKTIANKIRKTRKTYDKLWIGYYLESMKDRSIAWATTNFTPNLEVEILGATDFEEKKMNSLITDGNVIGKWQDVRPMAECGMILFEKDKKIYMKRAFGDGSSGDYEFIKKKYNGEIRYELKENKHKEY